VRALLRVIRVTHLLQRKLGRPDRARIRCRYAPRDRAMTRFVGFDFSTRNFGRNSRVGKNVRHYRYGGKNKMGTFIAKLPLKWTEYFPK
jgi:hypothetical protein